MHDSAASTTEYLNDCIHSSIVVQPMRGTEPFICPASDDKRANWRQALEWKGWTVMVEGSWARGSGRPLPPCPPVREAASAATGSPYTSYSTSCPSPSAPGLGDTGFEPLGKLTLRLSRHTKESVGLTKFWSGSVTPTHKKRSSEIGLTAFPLFHFARWRGFHSLLTAKGLWVG